MSIIEKDIWDYIQKYTNNPYGTAAIMGNLMAESSLNPKRVTGSKDIEYTAKADANLIDFAHDGCAYGLAQWCYWTRKEGLLSYAQKAGGSVGDLRIQLGYLIWEMSEKYKSVWMAVTQATDVKTASNAVMLKYEKPANISEIMKKRRADYGLSYFAKFVGEKSTKQVVVTHDRVNIRTGNGKEFGRIFLVNSGRSFDWVATAENGWHAVRLDNQVGWISPEFSKVE